MSNTQLRLRRGTTAEHANFTGAQGELTVDTNKNALVLHDGATQGGKVIDASLIVSVKDYGAKGDGSTDDTTAIQAAINSGAKSVFVPSGVYLVNSLTMSGSVRLYGEYEQSEIKLNTGPLLIKNQSNHVDNLKFSPQTGATCAEIIKFKGVSAASITAYNHLNRLFISASPTIDAIVFDATEKENLWNYIDTITIRNCKNGISFYAPNGNSSLYNNSNFTQRLDIHTCVKGVYFDDGYNEANIIAGLEVGEATTYELDFNNKAGASVSRTNIQDYISWDFLGTTRVNGYPNGGIMEGDSTTRLFAQVSGEYAATPLVIERNDSAGSVYAKYKNSSKSLSVGINAGLSGAPFHIPDITVMNSLRITDGVTIPGTIAGYASIYVDASDGGLKIKFGDGVVKTIA